MLAADIGARAVRPGRARRIGIVVATELAAAGYLLAMLVTDDWRLVLALLGAAGAGFVLMRRLPEIEARIAESLGAERPLAFGLGAILALAFPLVLGPNTYLLHLLILCQIYAALALALNFQLGSANIPNFATGATYGIGAYTSALLALNFGLSFWVVLPISALVATVFGFVLGIPSMRTRDSYLALVTIAFSVVVHQLLNNFAFTGGPNGLVGIPAPTLFGHSFARPIELFGFSLPAQANFYYLGLALLAVCLEGARRLHHSRVGLTWNALRSDEIAARAQGIDVTWYKVLAFAVDAFMAAFAGTIYAFYVSYIAPDNFTFLVSVTIMTMVIVGGMDNIFGVVVGACILTILPEKFRIFADYRLLFFGVAVIVMLQLRPQGLFPRRLRRYEHG
ncbi:MAG TPA: branched-chain amino acid ABC transporter permease [Beijerinckiaceae bacterium]|nr:branched-chain amino acid ABC transporter permease [Beijerinckiaceae bacterium]